MEPVNESTDMIPGHLINLLACPTCGASHFLRTRTSLVCMECASSWSIDGHIIDFLEPSARGSRQEKAYDGWLGKLYAAFMDSERLQLLDSWILGLKNRFYKNWFIGSADQSASLPFVEAPIGSAPFLGKASCYQNASWIGVDISCDMLRATERKALQMGLKNFMLLRASVYEMPLRPMIVTRSFSLFGFHCFHDKSQALSELARVTRPGGSLVLSALSKGHSSLADRYLSMYELEGSFAPCITPNEFRSLIEAKYSIMDEQQEGAVYLCQAVVP